MDEGEYQTDIFAETPEQAKNILLSKKPNIEIISVNKRVWAIKRTQYTLHYNIKEGVE